MKDNNVRDLFEQLAVLDKEINNMENKKKNYFFDNIDISAKEGEIELPLVAKSNSSDYEKLKQEKKYIQVQIDQLIKQNRNVYDYALEYAYLLRKQGFSEYEINVEKQKRIDQLTLDINSKLKKLYTELYMIDNDPKMHLRFKEYECCNYSSIKNKDVVKELENMDRELVKKQKMRKRILRQINKISKNMDSKEKKLLNMVNK